VVSQEAQRRSLEGQTYDAQSVPVVQIAPLHKFEPDGEQVVQVLPNN
jgi:hypothetical protein